MGGLGEAGSLTGYMGLNLGLDTHSNDFNTHTGGLEGGLLTRLLICDPDYDIKLS